MRQLQRRKLTLRFQHIVLSGLLPLGCAIGLSACSGAKEAQPQNSTNLQPPPAQNQNRPEAQGNPPQSSGQPTAHHASVSWSDKKWKFSIEYPGDLKTVSGSETLDLCPEGAPNDERIYVDVPHIPFHLPGTVTMGAVDGGFIDDLKKHYQDLEVQSEKDADFPDASAAKHIQATGKKDSRDFVIDATLAIRHDQVYVVGSETSTKYAEQGKAAVEQILKSWKWQ